MKFLIKVCLLCIDVLLKWIYPTSCLHCGQEVISLQLCDQCLLLIEIDVQGPRLTDDGLSHIFLFKRFTPAHTITYYKLHHHLSRFFIEAFDKINWPKPDGLVSLDKDADEMVKKIARTCNIPFLKKNIAGLKIFALGIGSGETQNTVRTLMRFKPQEVRIITLFSIDDV
ncbi:MAG: hypothetical protein JHC93_03415 [Parachlamydiales bacterium]|nr:hypothetical protein [Parachlamydiales bacterium]